MRSGPATQTASYVVSRLPCHRMAAERPLQPVSASKLIKSIDSHQLIQINNDAPPLPKPRLRGLRSCDHPPATAAAATGLCPRSQAPKSSRAEREEAAMPGQPGFAPERVILESPSDSLS